MGKNCYNLQAYLLPPPSQRTSLPATARAQNPQAGF